MDRKLRKLEAGERKPLEEHLQTARDEIGRLDSILKQFLQAVRPSTPQRESGNLNTILHDSLKLLQPELESRGIAVELKLEENLPLLELDPGQFQQVFYNLLRNAYQALSDDGRITLSSRSTDYEVELSIQDNGTGISPEHMGAIFEPYRTTKSSGSGLGLLIVRRIVREHGGEISIESEEGEGTRVTIHLPRQQKNLRFLEAPEPVIDLE